LNLDYTSVRAPVDGQIARRAVDVGTYVSAGTAIFGFVPFDERWVDANFKETQLDSITVGKKAEVTVDAIPGKTFSGVVESLSPATGATFTLLPPDNATGNFTKVVQRVPVRILLKNLSMKDFELLQAGLSANVDVLKHSKPEEVPAARQFFSVSELTPYNNQAGQSGE
jgi:membrane fusion protein (multidrug efflux system)